MGRDHPEVGNDVAVRPVMAGLKAKALNCFFFFFQPRTPGRPMPPEEAEIYDRRCTTAQAMLDVGNRLGLDSRAWNAWVAEQVLGVNPEQFAAPKTSG